MFRRCLVLLTLLTARSTGAAAAAQCDPAALRNAADTARSNIIAAVDGAEALDAWKHVIGRGGAIAWSVTEYNVDAHSTFVLTFDQHGVARLSCRRVRRGLDRSMTGCVDPGSSRRRSSCGRTFARSRPATGSSGSSCASRSTFDPTVGNAVGSRSSKPIFTAPAAVISLTCYNVRRELVSFWNFDLDVYRVEKLRGIAVGPSDFQRRLQFVLARTVDPEGRIALPRKGRGAGW